MKKIGLVFVLILAACDTGQPAKPGFNPTTIPDGGVSSPVSDGGKRMLPDGGMAEDDSGADWDPVVSPRRPYHPADINHILVNGQSNAVALNAIPTSLTQPYHNVSFNTGVMPMTNCIGNDGCTVYETPSSFLPLVEGDTFFNGGRNETCGAAFANEVTRLFPSHTALVSNHGRSGNTYSCLRKIVCNYKPGYLSPFAQGMMEVKSGKEIAAGLHKSYRVQAVLSIHGESDHYGYAAGTPEFPMDSPTGPINDYGEGLMEWQRDYQQGIQEITGQTDMVPLLISQISAWGGATKSEVAQFQLEAHIKSHGRVILVSPGYFMPFQTDCRHYTAQGQLQLGKYFARAYKRAVIDGLPWNPVRPKRITIDNGKLDVQYYVPVPPLVLDTTWITNPGDYGFKYEVNGVALTITDVRVTSFDMITISFTEAAQPGILYYAQNQTAGCATVRGNVRDSDNSAAETGFPMHNWGVLFMEKVPYQEN